MLVLNLPFKALMFLTLMRPSLVLFLVLWLKLVKDFLKVRCRLALLPFLISCLIWLDLVASLPLIKERILVIILLLHFLSLMLGSVLVLMLPLLVWLTPDLRIKKSLLKCNWTIRKRLPRCKMRLKKRLLAFSRRLHARIRKTRYMHKMRCLLINRRSLLRAFLFFQAEDGIRDVAVTGVQTCALPIYFSARRAKHPGQEALEDDQSLAMPGNDGFAFPFGNRPQNLTRRFLRRHHQPRCNGLFRFFMKLSLVVDPSDLTGYKARTDQRHRHSGQPQLRRNRIGQRANGELAHGVRRGAWRRRPARHTSNDSDVAFVFLDFGERRVNRSQHAKDVGLKLSPVILEREFLQWANHAKAGVGDRHIQFSPLAHRFRHRCLQIAFLGDVAPRHQRLRFSRGRISLCQILKQFLAPGCQRQLRPRLPQLPRQLLADSRRSAGDHHHFVPKERLQIGRAHV